MALPVVTFSTFPGQIDVFIDPLATSPTAFGTSTDHALEHSKINDAAQVMEYMLYGVNNVANAPQGVPILDRLGRLLMPPMAINVAIIAYGDGNMVVPAPRSTSGADNLTLTNKRLSGLGATTYAVTGSRLLDTFFDLLGAYGGAVSGATWNPAKPGIVILSAERNDFYNPTSGSTWANLPALAVTNYGQTLTACLAIIQSGSRAESASGTTTGMWTSNSGNFSGGTCSSTTAQNATLTYPAVTVPPTGDLWHLGYSTTTATGDSTFSIVGGSGNIATATTGGLAGASAIFSLRASSINAPSSFMPQITHLTGLTAGANVQVVVTKTDASTNPIYSDAVLVPRSTLPLTVVAYDNIGNNTNPVPTSPPTGWATQLTVAAVNKPLVDAQITNVVATFTNTATVDFNAGLTSHDLSYVDGLNPNDRGQRKISDLISYTIGNWAITADTDSIYTTL